jgi:hypothetical protein
LQVKSSSGEWLTVAAPEDKSVKTRMVACTATRLDMFDKLTQASDPPILQSKGWMVHKTADAVDVHGFTVHDNLREMILCEDSANRGLLSELDKQEFLYKAFCHLVLGGRLNQYEDDVDEYRQAVKSLYRTLVRCVRYLLRACSVRSGMFKLVNDNRSELLAGSGRNLLQVHPFPSIQSLHLSQQLTLLEPPSSLPTTSTISATLCWTQFQRLENCAITPLYDISKLPPRLNV